LHVVPFHVFELVIQCPMSIAIDLGNLKTCNVIVIPGQRAVPGRHGLKLAGLVPLGAWPGPAWHEIKMGRAVLACRA
jgi:hypothetical protein